MANAFERELGWNDEIQNDSTFTLLPEGDYPFTVLSFERGRYTPKPGAKLSACNMAILTIEIDGGTAGKAVIKHNLMLHTRVEGLLCAFFTSIGARRHGEPLAMPWESVPGASGRCHVYVDKWTGRDGQEMESNKIRRFLEPEAPKFKAGAF